MMNKITAKYVEENEFRELLASDIPLVVDFTASWCGPCKLMSPLIDRLANNYDGQVNVVKVDVDKNRTIAKQYNIKSIPLIIFFKKSELQKKITGLVSYEQISEALDALIE